LPLSHELPSLHFSLRAGPQTSQFSLAHSGQLLFLFCGGPPCLRNRPVKVRSTDLCSTLAFFFKERSMRFFLYCLARLLPPLRFPLPVCVHRSFSEGFSLGRSSLPLFFDLEPRSNSVFFCCVLTPGWQLFFIGLGTRFPPPLPLQALSSHS